MKIDNLDIFEQIGNAFYAVAADQHVRPLEQAELKMLISNDWLPRYALSGEQPLASEEAHAILMTMDTLQSEGVSANQAFSKFEMFIALHPEVFTAELKERILQTAEEIVKIFKHDNKTTNRHLEAIRRIAGIGESVGG